MDRGSNPVYDLFTCSLPIYIQASSRNGVNMAHRRCQNSYSSPAVVLEVVDFKLWTAFYFRKEPREEMLTIEAGLRRQHPLEQQAGLCNEWIVILRKTLWAISVLSCLQQCGKLSPSCRCDTVVFVDTLKAASRQQTSCAADLAP